MIVNYYEILGVSPNSEIEVITAAYKAMMRKYHPDVNNSAYASERAKEINEAYEVLRDPARRRDYDTKINQSHAHSAAPPPPPPPPPPPANVNHPPSETDDSRQEITVDGEGGALSVWVIFAAAYVGIALFYYGPIWISTALEVGYYTFWAMVAGAAIVPFGIAFAIMKLWKYFSSSISELKTDRMRWLVIQTVIVVVAAIASTQTERAMETQVAPEVTNASEQPASAAPTDTAWAEDFSKCYEANEAKNWRDALASCKLAADKGDAVSQVVIGYIHDNGFGVPKNPAEAARWYRKAAEQGNSTSQYNLGLMYESGSGVRKNIDEAIRWYHKAADQGDKDAKNRISELESISSSSKSQNEIIPPRNQEFDNDNAFDEGLQYILESATSSSSDKFISNKYSSNGNYTQPDVIENLRRIMSEGPTKGNSYVVYKALSDGQFYPPCRTRGRVDKNCTDFDRYFTFTPNTALAKRIKRR